MVTGIGRTGVVGVIRGRLGAGPTIGLRADMDALPITEATGKPYASATPGKMHACGHDGHTAMLLGAAKYLAETRNFAGTVAVIFQPAEEGGGGGNEMVKDGMMERFGIEKVFGLHNMPGLPLGQFATRPGPIMAATDEFTITIKGKGGHAAMPQPHDRSDRRRQPAGQRAADDRLAHGRSGRIRRWCRSPNSMPATPTTSSPTRSKLAGTVRTLRKEVARSAQERMRAIAAGIARPTAPPSTSTTIATIRSPVNHPEETAFASEVAAAIAGEPNVHRAIPPVMGGEDFSYMLEARPGAFIFIGNGDTAGLHHPAYDFNDEVIPHGVSYWVRLAETALAA